MKHPGGDLAYFADDAEPDLTDADNDVDLVDVTPALVDASPALVDGPPVPATPQLTELEKQVLGFERQWWRLAGAKEQAIRDTFDLSATRYYQVLNCLLDNPAALAHDPVLVGRLRRLRFVHTRVRG